MGENGQDGVERRLVVLARGLEANPKSEELWCVYLRLFLSRQASPTPPTSAEVNDLFQSATRFLPASYPIWAM